MKRRIEYLIFYFIVIALGYECNQPVKESTVEDNGTSSSDTSFAEKTFDSSSFVGILAAKNYPDTISNRLKDFYRKRNYQFAWFTNNSLAEQAANFWNAQSNYISYTRDSSLYDQSLQQMMDSVTTTTAFDDSTMLKTEVGLTVQFFRYARRAYQGNIRLGEHDLEWYIPRKRLNMADLLDSLITTKGENLEAYEPVNKQYRLLKEKLLSYYQMSEKGEWPIIETNLKLQAGDSIAAVVSLKKRLHTTGDFKLADTSMLFTDTLVAAVKNFQRRYGLKEDGIVSGTTLQDLNEPIDSLIRKILVNMERMRWIPVEPTGDFILVNIPQYKLIGYENGTRNFEMNIVAGSTQNQTVIFTGELKYVVFSPYWNVPKSIIKKEILPGIRRNPKYLAKHNMEWNNGAVRQKPGPNNSLGRVKFLFPNNYNIYLHDTPAKSLFEKEKRAFSHGCIRLAEPKKLAMWLLRNQPDWTEKKIEQAMNSNKEKFVTVTSTVPVFLGYFTAWVDEKGNLNFREDIYGHDKKLADRLFSFR